MFFNFIFLFFFSPEDEEKRLGSKVPMKHLQRKLQKLVGIWVFTKESEEIKGIDWNRRPPNLEKPHQPKKTKNMKFGIQNDTS